MQDHLLANYLTKDLFTYCSEGINFDLYEQPHRMMCKVYEDALPPPPQFHREANQRYVMTLWPRETLKTSIGCQGLSEYYALKSKLKWNYDTRILIVRSAREASSAVLGAIEEDLSTINPVLQRAFGDLSQDAPQWNEHAAILNCRSIAYREPTFDSAATGVSRTGWHYDLVIVDDIANENNFESEAEMLRAKRYITALIPVLNSWGTLLVIGTRWGHNDPYGALIDLNEREDSEGRPKPWDIHCTGYRLEDGRLFYPAYLTEEKLAAKRRTMYAMTGSDKLFMASYLNVVTTDESAVFKKSEQRFYEAIYFPRSEMPAVLEVSSGPHRGNTIPVECAIHIDPATAITAAANKTGITVVLSDKEGNRWVHDCWEGKSLIADTVSRVVSLARHYRPYTISIDVWGQQILWVDRVREALRLAGLDDISITQYRGIDGKVGKGPLAKAKRIESLGLLFREQRLFLHEGRVTPIIKALDTYNGITSSQHYDVLDALAHTMTVYKAPKAERYNEDYEAAEAAIMAEETYTEEALTPKRGHAGMRYATI